MKNRIAKFFSLLAALVFFGVPTVSNAITVTGIEVDIGTTVYTIWNGSGANQLGAAGTTVNPGGHLVLTQFNNTATPFNFDTSDVTCGGTVGGCPAPVIKVTISGAPLFLVTDGTAASNVLHTNNADPLNAQFNEAQAWVLRGSTVVGNQLVQLYVGYADDAHTNACLDAAEGAGTAGNCHPDNPWQGSANTTFLGSAQDEPTPIGCARTGITSCFDAGALRISVTTTPEPSAMFLLGAGLVGLVAWARGRQREPELS